MEPRRDPLLEAAIRAVGAWRGRDLGVTPMSAEDGERHFLIESDDELFVLRLSTPMSNRPRLDTTAELEIARSAANAGVAPEVVASLPQLGCLVTRFAPGRRIATGDLERDDVLASVVGAVRALHACPTPSHERSAFGEARDLRRAAVARGEIMPAAERAATDVVARIERSLGTESRSPVACHGDLTSASLLLDGEHVSIVDFRWAGAGDTFEDLGSIAVHFDLSEARADALLAMYFGTVSEPARVRLSLLRQVMRYLAAMRTLTRSSVDVGRRRLEAQRQFEVILEAIEASPG